LNLKLFSQFQELNPISLKPNSSIEYEFQNLISVINNFNFQQFKLHPQFLIPYLEKLEETPTNLKQTKISFEKFLQIQIQSSFYKHH
jgi:hypothetical protein